MSIANLFSPNDYDLFCRSLTMGGGGGGGTGSLFVDNIDTVNIGDAMTIGTVKAGNMFIGSPTNIVTVPHLLTSSNLQTDLISAATIVPMVIGTNAAGLNLQPNIGNIVIDDGTPTLAEIQIGTANSFQVVIGKPSGIVMMAGPVQFQQGNDMLNHFSTLSFAGTGTGCIPATPNYIQFDANRIDNMVTLSWTFTGPAINATIATDLDILELLPMEFRPAAIFQVYTCSIVGNSILPPSAGDFLPGNVTVDSLGQISFHYMAVTHDNNTSFVIGSTVEVSAGSISYIAL